MSLFAYCICNSMRGTRDRVHILLIGLSKEHVLLYFSISSFIVRQPNLVVSRGDVTLYHVLHIIRRVYSLEWCYIAWEMCGSDYCDATCVAVSSCQCTQAKSRHTQERLEMLATQLFLAASVCVPSNQC